MVKFRGFIVEYENNKNQIERTIKAIKSGEGEAESEEILGGSQYLDDEN